MRSRTEWPERVLRAIGVLALLGALVSTARPSRAPLRPTVDSLRVVDRALDARLVSAITRGTLSPSQLLLRVVPDDSARALLHAARDAALPLGWSVEQGITLPAVGIAAHGVPAPVAQTVVRASAGNASWLTLHDDVGWVDSVDAPRGDVCWSLSSPAGSWCVETAATRACTRTEVPARRSRVRVYGAPGWELQFTMRALEEAGVDVEADVSVAPRARVRVGARVPLDTSAYAALVALDSTAWSDAAMIARFVREGGGLIVLADAAKDAPRPFPVVTPLGPERPAVPGALRSAVVLDGLSLRPPRDEPEEAVVFERSARPGQPAVVMARRFGAGRVVQTGVRDLWLWRMTGGDDAPAAHRAWWERQLIRAMRSSGAPDDADRWYGGSAAPLADLHARLGPPSPLEPPVSADVARPSRPSPWWLVVSAAALVAEWWLRRRRGAR